MNPSCYLLRSPTVRICYIYVPENPECEDFARRFVESYARLRPQIPHALTVILNAPDPHSKTERVFAPVIRFDRYQHTGEGWDIGGFIAYARTCQEDILLCFGAHAYVQHQGWLERLVEAWLTHGPGLYGTVGSFEQRPHLNTTGFICPPSVLADYPIPMRNKADRYFFEWGRGAFWLFCAAGGLPVKLVTWDGEYDWRDWRTPPNIYRRGDQSNVVAFFRHTDVFAAADRDTQARLGWLADSITDPEFSLFASDPTINIQESTRVFFRLNHGVCF